MSTIDKEQEIRAFRKLELKKHGWLYNVLNKALKNPYVLIAPAEIIALGTTIFALVFCIVMSFMKWDLITGERKFVGLHNYKFIFTDELFLTSLLNTVVFMLVSVFVGLVLKVLVGVFLNKNKPGHNLVQTVMFTPYIIATVAIAVVFKYMMKPENGVFNQILTWLHLPTSQWYMGQDSALMSLAFIFIWQSMGYGALIVISGISCLYSRSNLRRGARTLGRCAALQVSARSAAPLPSASTRPPRSRRSWQTNTHRR